MRGDTRPYWTLGRKDSRALDARLLDSMDTRAYIGRTLGRTLDLCGLNAMR